MSRGQTPERRFEPWAVPAWPWVAAVGRSAMKHRVYVYEADIFGLTLGASNGSLAGEPLVRFSLRVSREAIELANLDLGDYAAQEIRRAVNAGYVGR